MKKIATAELLTIKEASEWASNYTGKNVTTSNIAYLIQYGRIKKIGENGSTKIALQDLINYYKSYNGQREISWKNQLGINTIGIDVFASIPNTNYTLN
ncbi:MAG: hypothetical protein LBM67_02470 [Lentimicrobiaceae bacterium]|jgi:hypothetical protein|nr:hypothetical protein [Lentimicrobiaceae bacterium]